MDIVFDLPGPVPKLLGDLQAGESFIFIQDLTSGMSAPHVYTCVLSSFLVGDTKTVNKTLCVNHSTSNVDLFPNSHKVKPVQAALHVTLLERVREGIVPR